MTLLLAFASSLFFAAAYVLQYHEAHEAPRRLFLSPRLLVELAHHRIWVGGIVAMLVGDGLQAAALGVGSLAVVEPVLTASLLFALPISAAWRRERLQRSEWVGAVMVSAGLGLVLGVCHAMASKNRRTHDSPNSPKRPGSVTNISAASVRMTTGPPYVEPMNSTSRGASSS